MANKKLDLLQIDSIMKKSIVFISVAIATAGFIAFGFISKSNEPKQHTISTNQTYSSIAFFGNVFTENDEANINQDFYYELRANYNRPILMEDLEKANSVRDLVPSYSSDWITDYSSVEITTTSNNQKVSAISPNDILTTGQKNILHSADMGADIFIKVNYKAKNPVTNDIEDSQMDVSMTLVPELEAEYIGGHDQMVNYLKENGLDEIAAKNIDKIQQSSVNFSVNEQGQTEEVKLTETSGIPEMDKLLVELISNMPNWKPAENSKGEKVKQQFEFNFGLPGC